MKRKPKLSLIVNISVICLCVCAIAIGVYSVKNASLSVSGTIGFNAHDCSVKITATTTSADEANSKMVTSDAKSITLGAKDTTNSTDDNQILTTNTGELSFGSLLFSDLIDGGDVITISLKIENLSEFKITANTPAPSLATAVAGVSCETTAYKFNLDAGASKDVTMTLTLADIANASSITSNKFTISLSFEKFVPIKVQTASDFRHYTSVMGEYSETSRSYLEMGSTTVNGETKNLRWLIFAQGDADGNNMSSVTGTVATDSNGYLTSGTYWFISELALDAQAFKSDGSSNVYNTSDIKKYINGDYLTNYNISYSEIYSKIFPRDLLDDNIGENANSEVGAFETTNNQKLWLLSMAEKSYLGDMLVAGNSGGFPNYWWTRSPVSGHDNKVWYVSDEGGCYYGGFDATGNSGVRPAFQITI